MSLSVSIVKEKKDPEGNVILDKNQIIIMGGDPRNPTYEEFLSEYKESMQERFKLIRKHLEENNMVGLTADKMEEIGDLFVFSDGVKLGFTWRGWGDFMQAIVGEREGYMKYYMEQ